MMDVDLDRCTIRARIAISYARSVSVGLVWAVIVVSYCGLLYLTSDNFVEWCHSLP